MTDGTSSGHLVLRVVPVSSARFLTQLAETTLALDISGDQDVLPVLAAEFGVPCIALAENPDQRRLWPDLCLTTPDIVEATRLSRWMLTDHGDAAKVTRLARSRVRRARRQRV